jgi:hypothetical protein
MWVCEGTTKYYKQQKQVSYNQGQTWSNLNEYRMGALYESDSEDCGAVIIMYRWINLNPSTDYYCSGTTKYYKQQKQVSYDEGMTWENVSPSEYQWGGIAETQSTACGYVPPTIYRWTKTDDTICIEITNEYKLFTRSYPHTIENDRQIPCDADGVLSRSIVQNYYYGGYQGWSHIIIGDCVTEIGENTFKGFVDIGLPSTPSFVGTYIQAKVPPTLHPNSQIIVNKGLYVPSESVELYKTSPVWKNYADKIIAI